MQNLEIDIIDLQAMVSHTASNIIQMASRSIAILVQVSRLKRTIIVLGSLLIVLLICPYVMCLLGSMPEYHNHGSLLVSRNVVKSLIHAPCASLWNTS